MRKSAPAHTQRKRLNKTSVVLEISALVIIGCLFTILAQHINTTAWKDFFFGYSDMLTLPLVWKSVLAGEPFNWVFSSQIFFFPELPLYIFSSLFSGNFKITILINAFLNIGIFYVLLRLITRSLSKDKIKTVAVSTILTALPLLLAIIEDRHSPNIAMFFFTTTAYYGVILSGLLSVLITIKLLKQPDECKTTDKRTYMLLGTLLAVSILTGMSNPMFFLQFSAPFLVVIALLFWKKFVQTRLFLLLAVTQVLGIIFALLARKTVFKNFFSPLGDVSSYLHFDSMIPTIKAFRDMALQLLNGGIRNRLELLVGVLLVIGAFTLGIYFLYKIFRKKSEKNNSPSDLFLIGFGTVSTISSMVGVAITGNALTRYLLPVILFFPLACIPFLLRLKWPKAAPGLCLTSLILATIVIASNSLSAFSSLTTYYPSASQCVDTSLSGTEYKNGVAQYWRARVLDLNSKQEHVVEQTLGNMTRFTWLYNPAAYDKHDVSFVIVDIPEHMYNIEVPPVPTFVITKTMTTATLGEPSHVFSCGDFDIYTYDQGSTGRELLNQLVRDRSKGL